MRTEPGDTDDRAIVKVDVTEQSTGSINFGVGYSSANGPTGEISIQEANFLGRGQFVRGRFRIAKDSRIVDLTFEEPAFLDRDLRLGLNAFYRDEDLDFGKLLSDLKLWLLSLRRLSGEREWPPADALRYRR